MAQLSTSFDVSETDPLDTLEHLARRADMEAQRVDDSELHVNLPGTWRDVGIWFGWHMEMQILQIGAPLEMKVPEARIEEVHRLLVKVNAGLWLGHFDLSDGDRGIVYRNSAVLSAGQQLDDCQADVLLRGAMDAFERFYPAFNFVVWGGHDADTALSAAIGDVAGTA